MQNPEYIVLEGGQPLLPVKAEAEAEADAEAEAELESE